MTSETDPRELADAAAMIRAAMLRGEWERVADLRARYLARWDPADSAYVPSLPYVAGDRLDRLFGNIARMHDIGKRHRVLILENVNDQGWVSSVADSQTRDTRMAQIMDDILAGRDPTGSFGAARDEIPRITADRWEPQTDVDVDWLADDLITLRHQLDREQWLRGAEVYRNAAKSSKAGEVMRRVEERVPPEDAERAASRFATPALAVAHLEVRIASVLLRHGTSSRVDFAVAIDGARTADEPGARIERLLRITEQAHVIDWAAQNAAIQAILETAAVEAAHDPAGLASSLTKVAATANAIGHRRLLAVTSGLAGLAQTLADPAQIVEPERIADQAKLVQSGLAGPWCEAIAALLAAYVRVAAANNRPEFRPILVLAMVLAGQVPEAHGRTELLIDLAGTASWSGWLADDDPTRDRATPKTAADRGVRLIDDLANANPADLVNRLFHELHDLERDGTGGRQCRLAASNLAVAVHKALEFYPEHRAVLAATSRDLGRRYGEPLLAELRSPSAAVTEKDLSAANNLGFGIVNVLDPKHDPVEELELGIALLTQAKERTDPEAQPEAYGVCANNLALGYGTYAGLKPPGERLDLLRRAEALFVETAGIGERLAAAGAKSDSRYVDYANLGDARLRLAASTYDSRQISHKPVESAHWYRTALHAYGRSAELARQQNRKESEAHAAVRAAKVHLRLIDLYSHERYYGGGDLSLAFYEWLCAYAEGHVDTRRLVVWWAASALGHLQRAVELSLPVNPSLVLECVDAAVELVALSLWRDAVAPDVGRHALAMIVELFDDLAGSGLMARLPGELGPIAETTPLWTALLSCEAFRAGMVSPAELEAAGRLLAGLGSSPLSAVRAIAWPWRTALEFERTADGALITGLLIEDGGDALALTIPSLRRSVRLGGMRLAEMRPGIRTVTDLRSASLGALWHLTPTIDWDDLPAYVACGEGTAAAGKTPIRLAADRLPTSGWDSWLVEVDPMGTEIEFEIGLPYIGWYNQITRVLDTQAPGEVRRKGELLVFGAQGITVEVTARSAAEDGDTVEVTVTDRSLSGATIRVLGGGAHLLLKASPRIAFSDVAFVVREDASPGAAACAATFSHATPSIEFPAEAMHGYGPLLYFRDGLDDDASNLLATIHPREVVLVGAPDRPEDAARLLVRLFEPRRELIWLVDPAEAATAVASLSASAEQIQRLPGARYLLRTAASARTPFRFADTVQMIVVPRALAPAAAQMMLDLAALRRRDVENIPMVLHGSDIKVGPPLTGWAPGYVSVKGNPAAARQTATLFDNPVDWAALLRRYRHRIIHSVGEDPVLHAMGHGAALMHLTDLRAPRRPVLVVDDLHASLVSAIPHARLLGALVVPLDEAAGVLSALEPAEVYATDVARYRLPDGAWQVLTLPGTPADMAHDFQQRVRRRHADRLGSLGETHPHLLASRALLAEMSPAEYVVLSALDPAQRQFAFLAANYAAALQAPLFLMPESDEAFAETRGRAERLVTGEAIRGASRDALLEEADAVGAELLDRFAATCDALHALAPRFVALVSSYAGFPIELVGDPPLATRYAVGRLSGPDLPTTALLVARAALSEDVLRPPDIQAVLAECADAVPGKPVPEARAEVGALTAYLGAQPHVRAHLVTGGRDLSEFLPASAQANLIHFAGHCWFDEERSGECGLIFREGVLTTEHLSSAFTGLPIVFTNACETGLLTPVDDGQGVLWTGIASAFLAAGAVNYVGSLWPVFDEGSRQIAEVFYDHLCAGEPVGEALRLARLDSFERHDLGWAAYVLFGCPRNRLRPPV